MQASIQWLKEYVEITDRPEDLAEKYTMAGIPVENVVYYGQNIEKIVTGKVREITHHTNANKLHVCKLDVGKEVLVIVTGAQNVKQNDIVPVALPGAHLPSGMVIEPTDFRGVMSYGMLCSAKELGLNEKVLLPEEKEGIFILPPDTPIGQDICQVLGLDDVVLEFELTPNRADCFSMIGLAREAALLTGKTANKPILNVHELGQDKASSFLKIAIDDAALCDRFAARILTDVKVGPSPAWLKRRLNGAGIRSINNVVDVTNYVMLELGQPMHAYDYNMLSGQQIVVRRAEAGEKLTTLDSVKRELTPDMLVIADAAQPVGLAGVMGGLASEVTASTKTIVLEAASFNSASIRKTSRKLGLRSEASGRFERGVDRVAITKALDRAAQLLSDMGAATVCPGIVDQYPKVLLPQQISFTADEINAYLGTQIDREKMLYILQKLEFKLDQDSAGNDRVTVPTWRNDVTGMPDLAEEVARVVGYDQIVSTTPFGMMERGGQSGAATLHDSLKELLVKNGFCETVTYSFFHPSAFDRLQLPESSELRRVVPLMNPIVEEFSVLRSTLLANVLETVARNLSRKNADLRIFELGSVFIPNEDKSQLPEEPMRLVGAMTGLRNEAIWNQGREAVDFYDAKGIVENLLIFLGIQAVQFVSVDDPTFHPGKTARVLASDGTVLGLVGEIHPKVQEAFELSQKVYVFDLAVSELAKAANLKQAYTSLPKFPAILRDLAVVLPVQVPAEKITQAIYSQGGTLLKKVNLFDVYTGEQVAEGFRSLAFSLVYQSPDRTLTDGEVDGVHRQIVQYLEKAMSAKLRS